MLWCERAKEIKKKTNKKHYFLPPLPTFSENDREKRGKTKLLELRHEFLAQSFAVPTTSLFI